MARTESQTQDVAAGTAPPIQVTFPEQVNLQGAPMTREQLRLECLKIALQRGLGIGTDDMRAALNKAVDLYEQIVTGDFRGSRVDSAAPGTPSGASEPPSQPGAGKAA